MNAPADGPRRVRSRWSRPRSITCPRALQARRAPAEVWARHGGTGKADARSAARTGRNSHGRNASRSAVTRQPVAEGAAGRRGDGGGLGDLGAVGRGDSGARRQHPAAVTAPTQGRASREAARDLTGRDWCGRSESNRHSFRNRDLNSDRSIYSSHLVSFLGHRAPTCPWSPMTNCLGTLTLS